MPFRRKKGQLVRVSAAQTVACGRPSRAKNPHLPPQRTPLPGEDGAIVSMGEALVVVAALPPDARAVDRERAAHRVRDVRARLVRELGRERAREVEADVRLIGRDLASIALAPAEIRARLFGGAVDAVKAMGEFSIGSRTAKVRVAISHRLLAQAQGLLDRADAHPADAADLLDRAARLIAQADRTLDYGLRVEDRYRTEQADHARRAQWAGVTPEPTDRGSIRGAAITTTETSMPSTEKTPPPAPAREQTCPKCHATITIKPGMHACPHCHATEDELARLEFGGGAYDDDAGDDQQEGDPHPEDAATVNVAPPPPDPVPPCPPGHQRIGDNLFDLATGRPVPLRRCKGLPPAAEKEPTT